MKKLLLTGIMALSISAFSAGTAFDAKEASVDIKAKVVQPLDIKTSPLDFGVMIPGETKWGDVNGIVDITGTPGENIKIQVKESEETGYVDHAGPRDVYNVVLTTGNGETENEKLPTELTLFTPGILGDQPEQGVYLLEKDGKKVFTVNGWAKAGANQKAGQYKGKIYVKAMYQ